jgi:hypothetical protein
MGSSSSRLFLAAKLLFASLATVPAHAQQQATCSRSAQLIIDTTPGLQRVRESEIAVLMRYVGGEISIQCEFISKLDGLQAIAVHWDRDSGLPFDRYVTFAAAMGSRLTGDPERALIALAQRCLERARHPDQLGGYQAVGGKTTLPCRNDIGTAAITFYKRLPADIQN